MFSECKVAQMAAYFLSLCHTHKMPHLKLMKLLYLADRQAMDSYGLPISGDKVVAMPHGPVLTMTLDFINGAVQSTVRAWEGMISDRSNHQVSLRHEIDRSNLDELSDADIGVLDSIWGKFGSLSQWELVDYTHEHCPEWEDPQGSSTPISYKRIFCALGRNRQEASELSQRIESESELNGVLASL